MIIRQFKGEDISLYGMGCMRLPKLGDGSDDSAVDEAAVQEMVDLAIEQGVNYFDTAWGYHNGVSEQVMGRCLAKHPRESFFLADKFPGYDSANWGRHEEIFAQQLQRCQVDRFDFYLVHNVCEMNIDAYLDEDGAYGDVAYLARLRDEGTIGHLGFSVHGHYDVMKAFLEKYGDQMEFVQIQLNYIDYGFQDAKLKLELAAEYGLPVIVMEPLKGGLLADPPASVKEIFDERMPDDSYATAALRFAASCPNVVTTLSGMATVEQVRDNCRLIADFRPMGDEELAVIRAAQEALASSKIVPCTGCDYCAKVCPANIGISQSINVLNHFINFGDAADSGWLMGFVVRFNAGKNLPVDCTRCGSCVEACPQGIDILECFDRIQDEIFSVAPTTQVLMKYNTLPKGN